MAMKIDKNRCPQNHKCPSIKVCPVGAISQEGFDLPVIDPQKCIECMECVKFCPRKAISKADD